MPEQLPLIPDADPHSASTEEPDPLCYCIVCWRYTTVKEAELRVFNTRVCGHCGGPLKVVSKLGER